jgi:hypothetical protein
MSSQIFRKVVPIEDLIKLFVNICIREDNYYILSNDSFKRGLLDNSIPEFIDFCKPFYFSSKQKYLERKLSFNSFVTIIRQICKTHNIAYKSQIKYNKSSYTIDYYIYV